MAFKTKPTLDGVLASFRKTLTQLDALILNLDSEVNAAAVAEEAARKRKVDAAAKIDKAVTARKNIEKLISE
jgi:hypothetical protein